MPAPSQDPNEEVTVTRAQLAQLQRGFSLLDKLYTSKDTATAFKRLAKQADPEGKFIKVPELDLADELTKPIVTEIDATKKELKELRETIAADKQKFSDDQSLSDLNAKIDAVVKTRGLTADGRKGLIETMQKRQVADPDVAAVYYLDSLPKPETQRPSALILPQRLGKFNSQEREPFAGADDTLIKSFFADPEGTADQVIADIINEAA
jgi:hypothetical protein